VVAVFTGIVEELGEVVAVEPIEDSARLTVRGPLVTAGASAGDSIAVNGVCVTMTATTGGTFSADVMGETLHRSSLGELASGSMVNLERPMRLDDRLGGHLVQGHVDGVGRILQRSRGSGASPAAAHWDVVRISVPPLLARYVVEKGSIAVDGISLTISALGTGPDERGQGDWIEVSLIPETLARTTLGRKQPGDPVNLEVDVIAKYVERLVRGSAS
jgi:riboflavin synthase